MEESCQLHVPATLPPGKVHWCPMNRRLGGLQSWSGHFGAKENSFLCLQPSWYVDCAILTPQMEQNKLLINLYHPCNVKSKHMTNNIHSDQGVITSNMSGRFKKQWTRNWNETINRGHQNSEQTWSWKKTSHLHSIYLARLMITAKVSFIRLSSNQTDLRTG